MLIRYANQVVDNNYCANDTKFAADDIDGSEKPSSVNKIEYLVPPLCCGKCSQWKHCHHYIK